MGTPEQRIIRRHQLPNFSSTSIDPSLSDGAQIGDPLQAQVPTLTCGWPDLVGVYKWGKSVDTSLLNWGTCEDIVGSLDSVPIRATVAIKASVDGVLRLPSSLRGKVF